MGASVENLILTLHNYTSNSQKERLKMVLNNGTIEHQFCSESQEPPFSFHNYSKNCISKPMLPNSQPMLPNSQPILPNSKDSQPIFSNSQLVFLGPVLPST